MSAAYRVAISRPFTRPRPLPSFRLTLDYI